MTLEFEPIAYLHMCIYMYVCMCVCVYVCMCLCMYVFIHTCAYISTIAVIDIDVMMIMYLVGLLKGT